MNGERQYCTFYLGGLFLGVEVLRVQEVIRPQPLTRMPLAHPAVRGLMNLRGQIVTALELRRLLGLPERPDHIHPMNVVVQTDDGAVSLLVDEIGEVLTVDQGSFEPPPETVSRLAQEYILGAYKLTEQLLLPLDLDKITNIKLADAA